MKNLYRKASYKKYFEVVLWLTFFYEIYPPFDNDFQKNSALRAEIRTKSTKNSTKLFSVFFKHSYESFSPRLSSERIWFMRICCLTGSIKLMHLFSLLNPLFQECQNPASQEGHFDGTGAEIDVLTQRPTNQSTPPQNTHFHGTNVYMCVWMSRWVPIRNHPMVRIFFGNWFCLAEMGRGEEIKSPRSWATRCLKMGVEILAQWLRINGGRLQMGVGKIKPKFPPAFSAPFKPPCSRIKELLIHGGCLKMGVKWRISKSY